MSWTAAADPGTGRGKRLAQDAQLKIAHDKRARVFIDPKLGSARFRDECEKWISRHPGTEATKLAYRNILNAHVGPVSVTGRSRRWRRPAMT